MTDDAPRYTRAADLEVHDTEDGLIVFNPATDRVHHLNHSAGMLFELCQATHGVDELTQMMAAVYDADEPPRPLVEDGLRQLVAEGVLVEVGSE